MSDNPNDPKPVADPVLEAAMTDKNSQPAPASWMEQFMQAAEARLAQIETVLGIVKPLENIVETGVETFVPASIPVIAAITELQSIATGVLAGLGDAFGAKLPLPAAPAAPVHGAASPG